MDIVALTVLLSPCLPFLLKLGDSAIASAGEKIGEETWDMAKKIWAKLSTPIHGKDNALMATKLLASEPDNKTRQQLFQEELATLLNDNPDLAQAIAEIMAEHPAVTASVQINQTVTNNEGQVIGQMTGGKAIGRIDGNVQGGVNL